MLKNFNPRSPHGERQKAGKIRQKTTDFNPRSPHGERRAFPTGGGFIAAFQSTLPARGATSASRCPSAARSFQSTLPARGATRTCKMSENLKRISIHAPRTGSDRSAPKADAQSVQISIHAPRTGSDWMVNFIRHNLCISIHAPRTGSDATIKHYQWIARHFNPRSPHGERQKFLRRWKRQRKIFQSTLPARGATGTAARKYQRTTDFNPRSPHGERPDQVVTRTKVAKFQSTLPARGATIWSSLSPRTLKFQSTLPARGATWQIRRTWSPEENFNPRSPHGERRWHFAAFCGTMRISIHAPRTGSDPTKL